MSDLLLNKAIITAAWVDYLKRPTIWESIRDFDREVKEKIGPATLRLKWTEGRGFSIIAEPCRAAVEFEKAGLGHA